MTSSSPPARLTYVACALLPAICMLPGVASAAGLDERVHRAAKTAPIDAAAAAPAKAPAPDASAAPDDCQQKGQRLRRQILSLQPDNHFFSTIGIFRDGAPVGLTYFGGNAEQIFGDFAPAHQLMRRFRQDRMAATVLSSLGMAALITDLVLAITDIGDQPVGRGRAGAYFGLAFGGALASGIGAGLFANSDAHLMRAVAAYNTHLIDQSLLPTPASAPVVRWGPRGAGLALRVDY